MTSRIFDKLFQPHIWVQYTVCDIWHSASSDLKPVVSVCVCGCMCMIVRRQAWTTVTPGQQLSFNPHWKVPHACCSRSRLFSYRGKNKLPRQPCLPVWKWWTAHLSALHTGTPSPHPPPFSISIPLLHHFHPQSPFFLLTSLSLSFSAFSVLMVLLSSCTPFGKRPCLFNDERMKGSSGASSSLSFPPSFHPFLS